ncbi:MAG: hypothetical protein M1828_003080 [Chrysothrix sp. TS-e1954]|nr:MAG: hypothetical protein M1828_003080 [Chrysothrix sp. TS-e1954]
MSERFNDEKVTELSTSISHPSTGSKREMNEKEELDSTSDQADQPQRDVEAPPPTDVQKEAEVTDPNLVSWDGPDDPENPKNWSLKRKWIALLVVSTFTFMSPVASTAIAPALDQLSRDLHITGSIQSQLVFSIFMLAFGFGPLFLGPLSEVYGRVIVLQLGNAFFLAFSLACGFAQTKGQMLAFRFISGLGGCAPQAIGGAVVGDMFTSEQRGTAMALYTLMPLLGPAVGPISGGFIAEYTTWRWCFWSIVIFGCVAQAIGIFQLRETYAPELLKRKAKKLRKETGNPDLMTEAERKGFDMKKLVEKALVRPFQMLATQAIIQFLAVYMAFVYGLMYLMLSTFPMLWVGRYHESEGIGGLNYISLALGAYLGSQLWGRLSDRIYVRLKKRSPDGKGRPEFRVPLMLPGITCVCVGFFVYGWTAQYHTHWIGPNIGGFIFTFGVIAILTGIMTYIIEAYTLYAASASSATVILRSMAAFGFPLFAPNMYDALDYGWGNSLLGFLGLGLGLPGTVILWLYGERMRGTSRFAASSKPA